MSIVVHLCPALTLFRLRASPGGALLIAAVGVVVSATSSRLSRRDVLLAGAAA